MAPKTRAKSANAGENDHNPKQTIRSKLNINMREDGSKNTKRCGHCGASMRSEDTETSLQDMIANGAAKVSAEPFDSIEVIEPVDPRESAEVPSPAVPPEWNGRRRRSRLPTENKLEVADKLVVTTQDFRSRWDELVAADTMLQLKKDSNYSAPVQKEIRPKRNRTRRGRRS